MNPRLVTIQLFDMIKRLQLDSPEKHIEEAYAEYVRRIHPFRGYTDCFEGLR